MTYNVFGGTLNHTLLQYYSYDGALYKSLYLYLYLYLYCMENLNKIVEQS